MPTIFRSVRMTTNSREAGRCSAADVTELPDAKPEEIGRSIESLEATVRRMPEQKELQRRLVDLYGRIGGVQQAIDHLGIMVAKYPDDAELQVHCGWST